jgi:hypothetical protein
MLFAQSAIKKISLLIRVNLRPSVVKSVAWNLVQSIVPGIVKQGMPFNGSQPFHLKFIDVTGF